MTYTILGMWKQLVVYFAICLVICIYWVAHVMLFSVIQAADSAIAYLNVAFLLLLSCIPFTVSILAQNFFFYGLLINNAVLVLLGLVLTVLWIYVSWKYVQVVQKYFGGKLFFLRKLFCSRFFFTCNTLAATLFMIMMSYPRGS